MKGLYKLIILYMLENSNRPLSEDFIFSFFAEKGYTDFFTFRRSIDVLGDDGLIDVFGTYHKTLYRITPDGSVTLKAYGNERVSPEIKEEIKQYLSGGYSNLPCGGTAASYYTGRDMGLYDVKLMAFFDSGASAEFTVPAENEPDAQRLCEKWNARAADIFDLVKKSLQ